MEVLALGVGSAIAFMLVANAALQQALDPVSALLVVHGLGLVLVVPLALVVRSPTLPRRVDWPLFTGGLVGVVLVWINNRTVPLLGPGVAIALGVAGQLGMSALVDHFGWFGLERRPFRPSRAAGLVVAAAGVVLMVGV